MATVIATVTRSSGGAHARPTVLSCPADNVREALLELEKLAEVRALRPAGGLRPGIVVFVNSEDARGEAGLARPLHDGDVVRVVAPIPDT